MARLVGNGLNLQGQKIVSVGDGSASSDVASYGQLLALVNGKDYKDGVAAAPTANITVTAPGSTFDGYAAVSGDRLLLLNQTTASENGVWLFNGSSSPLTRPADFTTGLVTQGATVVVDGGTSPNTGGNLGTQWTLTTSGAITVGTTALSFTKTVGGAAYTASNGLQLASTAFSVKLPAASGLIADGTGLYVDTSIVVKKYASNFGDGSASTFTITHNLNTRDVQVTVYDNTTFLEEWPDVAHTTVNTVTLTYAAAPASASKRVAIVG